MATAGKGRANIPPLSPQILGQLLTLRILPNHTWSRSAPQSLTCSPTMRKSTAPRLVSVCGTVTTRGVEGSERSRGLGAAGAPVSQAPHPHFQTEVLRGCKLSSQGIATLSAVLLSTGHAAWTDVVCRGVWINLQSQVQSQKSQ